MDSLHLLLLEKAEPYPARSMCPARVNPTWHVGWKRLVMPSTQAFFPYGKKPGVLERLILCSERMFCCESVADFVRGRNPSVRETENLAGWETCACLSPAGGSGRTPKTVPSQTALPVVGPQPGLSLRTALISFLAVRSGRHREKTSPFGRG